MPDPTTTVTSATLGAGATPAATSPDGAPAGATPAPGTTATTVTTTEATDEPALGDAGKEVLRNARRAAKEAEDRAKAAETELQQLREAGQSEADKALNQARHEAAAEERAKWQGHIRSTEVRSHLRAAGLTDDRALGLAAGAPEFQRLKVTDEGLVEQVAETVAQFKKDYPVMFGTAASPGPGGPWGGAEGGANRKEPTTLEEANVAYYSRR